MSTRKTRSSTPKAAKSGDLLPALKSPGRLKRVEEREELSDLNKRLELYILTQREKDAARDGESREVETVRESFAEEIEQLKKSHEAQIKVIRKNRDDVVADNARLKAEKSRQAKLVDTLKKEISAQKKYKENLEDRNNEMSAELLDVKKSYTEAQSRIEQLQHDLQVGNTESAGNKDELREARTRADDASKSLASAESTAQNFKEDLEALTARHKKESERYAVELRELSRSRASVEDELRKEFGRQLKEILIDRQATYEEEKEAGLEALKDLYEEKLGAKRAEVAKVAGELAEARKQLSDLRMEVAGLRNASWETQKDVLETRVSSLSEQLRGIRQEHTAEVRTLRTNYSKEISNLKVERDQLKELADKTPGLENNVVKLEDDVVHWRGTATQLKAELKDKDKAIKEADKMASLIQTLEEADLRQKGEIEALQDEKRVSEQQYTVLLDVKVALDMEIAAYREMLEREETRVRDPAIAALTSATPTPKARKRRSQVMEEEKHETVEEAAEEAVPETRSSKRAKKTPAKKTPAKKTPAKKTPVAKKASSKKKPAAKKSTAKKKRGSGRKAKKAAEESMKIDEIDLEEGFINLINESDDNVVLDGWTLKAERSKSVFHFPDAAPVAPGEEVTVWLGEQFAAKAVDDKTFAWAKDDIFDPDAEEGDACVVYDPTGAVFSRVELSSE